MYIQNIKASLPERENALLFHVLVEEYYNSYQVMAGLEEEAGFYEERMKADDAQYHKACTAHYNKQTHFHKAQMINNQFLTLDKKHKQLKN